MESMESPTRLPPNTFLPPRASSEDPMVRFATDLMSTHQSTLDKSHAQALLGFGQLVPFDSNALVVGRSYAPYPVLSLLGFVLERSPYYSQGTRQSWPASLEGFDEPIVEKLCKDKLMAGEWVAAVFMAAGADPWRSGVYVYETEGKSVEWGYPHASAPVFHALKSGMSGLVELMLEKPGAPGLEELVNSAVPSEIRNIKESATESWFHAACAEPRLKPLLDWMLDKGVRPLSSSRRHVLEQATPRALEEFSSRGLMPVDKDLVRRLEAAWRARTKAGDLEASDQAKMSALVRGREIKNDDIRASEFMVLLTKNPWGKIPLSGLDGYAANTGVELLASVAKVPSGALSGQWSGLAAHLINRLRQSDDRGGGVREFDLRQMVGRKDLEASSSPSPLAGAIGFEWRNGAPIDGIVSLLLLGRDSSSSAYVPPDRWRELTQAQADLLGVGDALKWASSHVDAAITFTQAIVSRGSESAASTMTSVWARALSRHPDYLEGSMDRRLRLMSALHGDFSIHEVGRMNRLLQALTPWSPDASYISAPQRDLKALDAPLLSLALESALSTRKEPWLRQVVENMDLFSDRDLDRIQGWLKVIDKAAAAGKSTPAPALVSLLSSTLKARLFEISFPEGAKADPASRPRM